MARNRHYALVGLGALLLCGGFYASRFLGERMPELVGGDDEKGEVAELARHARDPFAQTFRHIAALVRPSIVYVEVRHASSLSPHSDFDPTPADDLAPEETLRRFFMNPFRMEGQGESRRAVTSATGVIVDRDGTILTIAHVLAGRAGASALEVPEIRVKLADGRWCRAFALGCEPRVDLAVLRLGDHPEGLTPAVLGDSDRLERGDWVLALGDPFGREPTASLGVVSVKGRTTLEPGFDDYLQTDAALNPGNAGGPLVDVKGDVVGFSRGPASTAGGSMGSGFAVPSNSAVMFRSRIELIARVAKGALGLTVRELFPTELGGRRGLLVADVTSDGRAAQVPIRAGDALLGVGGRDLLEHAQTGAKLSAELWRDGAVKPVEMELGPAARPW
jgi:serine protease Do